MNFSSYRSVFPVILRGTFTAVVSANLSVFVFSAVQVVTSFVALSWRLSLLNFSSTALPRFIFLDIRIPSLDVRLCLLRPSIVEMFRPPLPFPVFLPFLKIFRPRLRRGADAQGISLSDTAIESESSPFILARISLLVNMFSAVFVTLYGICLS